MCVFQSHEGKTDLFHHTTETSPKLHGIVCSKNKTPSTGTCTGRSTPRGPAPNKIPQFFERASFQSAGKKTQFQPQCGDSWETTKHRNTLCDAHVPFSNPWHKLFLLRQTQPHVRIIFAVSRKKSCLPLPVHRTKIPCSAKIHDSSAKS